MSNNPHIVSALRDELRALQADLASHPIYIKIKKIEDLLAEYEKKAAGPTASLVDSNSEHQDRAVYTIQYMVGETQKDRILRSVRDFIISRGGAAKRRDILAFLVDKQIIKTKKPIKTLAPILTAARELISDGKGVWRIKGDAAQSSHAHGGANGS